MLNLCVENGWLYSTSSLINTFTLFSLPRAWWPLWVLPKQKFQRTSLLLLWCPRDWSSSPFYDRWDPGKGKWQRKHQAHICSTRIAFPGLIKLLQRLGLVELENARLREANKDAKQLPCRQFNFVPGVISAAGLKCSYVTKFKG